MPTKYTNFTTVTQDGQEYIVAEPKAEHDDPVRFSSDIESTDDVEGTWRDVVQEMIKYDITEALNLEEGQGKLTRAEARESLLESENSVSIVSEEQADAVIDYFISEGVLEADGSKVVVLSNPEMLKEIASGDSDAETNTKMLLNWVSAINGCMTKIDETIQTVEAAEQEVKEEIGDSSVLEKKQRLEDNQEEAAQRLMNLTNGGQLNKADLTAEEQIEYERLEDRMFHLDSMIDAIKGGELDEELRKTAQQLGRQVNKLSDVKLVLEAHQEKLKRAYKYEEEIATQEAINMAQNLANVATTIANVESSEKRKDQQDTLAFAKQIAGVDVEGVSTDEIDENKRATSSDGRQLNTDQ